MLKKMTLAAAIALGGCTTVPAAAPVAAVAPVAAIDPAALAGIDQTMTMVYQLISGPVGQERDWPRLRQYFAPNATLRYLTDSGIRGGSLEDYIRTSGPLLTSSGFSERELARRVEVYGNLATVWSSYAGGSPDGKIKVSGINSFQLAKIEGRWLVATILWQPENAKFPLPADMRGN